MKMLSNYREKENVFFKKVRFYLIFFLGVKKQQIQIRL